MHTVRIAVRTGFIFNSLISKQIIQDLLSSGQFQADAHGRLVHPLRKLQVSAQLTDIVGFSPACFFRGCQTGQPLQSDVGQSAAADRADKLVGSDFIYFAAIVNDRFAPLRGDLHRVGNLHAGTSLNIHSPGNDAILADAAARDASFYQFRTFRHCFGDDQIRVAFAGIALDLTPAV